MSEKSGVSPQIISLPKGGGALKGISETFKPNLFTGTANFSVPIATSPGRGGFAPELTLQYSSGNGNGPFGLGWALSVPQVSRKTEKGIPRYREEDVFLLSGSEDLVERTDRPPREEGNFTVTTYCPRVEGLFARIEKWELKAGNPGNPPLSSTFWKITTKENITNIYGGTAQAILANPEAPEKIFQWLLELTYDAKGNYIHYEYKKEDGVGIPDEIYERKRSHVQVYLKRIRYGNLVPLNAVAPNAVENLLTKRLVDQDHFFMVVFDYGEHGAVDNAGHEEITSNMHEEPKPWEIRADPFSTYRAGFEIRTCRRCCKRVLMFHNKIPGENAPVLVKSTDFLYRQNKDTLVSMLAGVTQRGYKKAPQPGDFKSEEIRLNFHEPGVKSTVYEIKSIPRLEFSYTEFKPKEQQYKSFQAKGGEMPPNGLNDRNFALVDLFGTGLPDVLQTTATGYYFWRNLGDGIFDRRNSLNNYPAGITLDRDGVDFGDMAGDGQADLMVHTGIMWGFCEATRQGGWRTFQPYRSIPSFSLTDPGVRLVDLTGDGKSDALRTDQHHFTYFPCLGEEGFGAPETVERVNDLDKFPDVYFNDPSKRVHLADMTGDGLKDIVLAHSGPIDYWPNLGYGHFGKRITMKNSPQLGYNFDPRRLFFVDIDGSGPADLVYVESGKVRFWFNQSGNSWSNEDFVNGTPEVTDADSLQLADMLGNGSTGILWSSAYRGPQQSNYLFLDFTGGVKPYVLTEINNNMGATTKTKYTSSTKFYLEDLKHRKHWVTTIPFPVQVLGKVEIIDHIAKSKLVTTYTYHQGYYNGKEREFRGFGRVEQTDTEIFSDYNDKKTSLHGENIEFKQTDNLMHVPPIRTKSWFHTGVYEEEKRHLEIFRSEYYQGDGQAFKAHSRVEMGDVPFEAYRALKGSVLRTEVYALDKKPEAEHPYTVTENGFQVKKLQNRGDKNNGVFFGTSLESFTFHYERNPSDPRVSHKITHEIDSYGNILKSLDIVYPRRNPAYPEQGKLYITYDKNQFINQDEHSKPYFIGHNYESQKIELVNIANLPHTPLRSEDIVSLKIDDPGHNLFSHTRDYYDGPAYQGLTLRQVGPRGLLTRKEMLAFKQGQVNTIYGNKVQNGDLSNAGYSESPAGSGNWWVQTERKKYADDTQFFMPVGQLDPMGHETIIEYDQFSLLPRKTVAPLQTEVKAENDYRTLSPFKTIDPNLNHTLVEFDPLGMVIATAVMGKVGGQGNPDGDPLDHPTTRLVYDFFNYWKSSRLNPNHPEPNYVQTFKREEHYSIDPNAKEQESYTYSDGFGREIQTKVQAEPDPVNGTPRWVGSGWKIYNNKGWVVEQYEPFFAAKIEAGEDKGYEFENNKKVGVSATMSFDPLGRVIRTDNPDGSFSKVEFGPWHQVTWDGNDTLTDLKNANNTFVNKWYGQKSSGTPQEKDAAAKALAHKDTPTVVHLDTLGRSFLSIDNNGIYGKYETRSEFDIQGNVTRVTDPRGNHALEHKYDLLKNPCYRWQMDSGERFILLNAAGNPIKKWDSRHHLMETSYDELNRPTELRVTELSQNTQRLAEKTVYGEGQLNPEKNNLRGQIYQHYDGAGLVTNETYDFKGNLLKSKREILKNYKSMVDWSANPAPAFTSDPPLAFSAKYDALNRIKESITPDGSCYVPAYNEANLLDKVEMYIQGAVKPTPFVLNINYNAKGQREKVVYANGVVTEYGYDPETFRLTTLRSYKNNKDLQKYQYTYDPVGNITYIEDLSTPTIYFANNIVEPHRDFTYDPLYRLIEAHGREHLGQLAAGECPRHNEMPYIDSIPDPNNPQAMRRYIQKYIYDEVGNIREMRTVNRWFQTYTYHNNNNRLLKTTCGQNQANPFDYQHDAHGNHVNFSNIPSLDWDFQDQMVGADLGGGGKAYYLYDSGGQRVRKVVRYQNGNIKERIYLGGYEIFREYASENDLDTAKVKTRRHTLHVMDDKQRIAMVETLVTDNHASIPNPAPRFRYQLADHLGSAINELDENANIITFEKYYPYGGTSYHSTDSTSQVSQKRYRYSGKEKDEETGLYYYGARYYVKWLGRWVCCDPLEVDGINLYQFVRNNPITRVDKTGEQSAESDKLTEKDITIDVQNNNKPVITSEPYKIFSQFIYREYYPSVDKEIARLEAKEFQLKEDLKKIYDQQSLVGENIRKMYFQLDESGKDSIIDVFGLLPVSSLVSLVVECIADQLTGPYGCSVADNILNLAEVGAEALVKEWVPSSKVGQVFGKIAGKALPGLSLGISLGEFLETGNVFENLVNYAEVLQKRFEQKKEELADVQRNLIIQHEKNLRNPRYSYDKATQDFIKIVNGWEGWEAYR